MELTRKEAAKVRKDLWVQGVFGDMDTLGKLEELL